MRRFLVPIATMAVVAAACTGGGAAEDPPATTVPPTTSTTAAPTTSTTVEHMDDTVRFTVRVENVTDTVGVKAVGIFAVPDGADGPAPALPGGTYGFDVAAGPGDRLSFATMVVQSNDLFLATPPEGIPLYDGGTPLDGDITDRLAVWDAGTEADEPLGEGPNQAPRQAGPDTGAADPDPTVRMVAGDDVGLPPMFELAEVTVTPTAEGMFRVSIHNASDTSMGLQTPFAPGVFVVHGGGEPLFTAGTADRGDGLEALAEDGNPAPLADALSARGVVSPIAPGVWVLDGDQPLFTPGTADRGDGLEALAEDGNPSVLGDTLDGSGVTSGVFAVPEGGDGPAPAFPGDVYTFVVEAAPGDLLSVATMLVQSNDRFFAVQGLPLFDGDTPFAGTVDLTLWDAGTEMDQPAGTGSDQAPRQAGPDVGAAQNGTVEMLPGTGVRLVITPDA